MLHSLLLAKLGSLHFKVASYIIEYFFHLFLLFCIFIHQWRKSFSLQKQNKKTFNPSITYVLYTRYSASAGLTASYKSLQPTGRWGKLCVWGGYYWTLLYIGSMGSLHTGHTVYFDGQSGRQILNWDGGWGIPNCLLGRSGRIMRPLSAPW